MWGWGSAQKHSGRLLSLIPWSVVPSKSREKATKPSPGDLPSMGDISSQMLPSTTQLRHETSRWLSDDKYNDAVYFTSLRARYSLIHTISFNSHNCPEPSVLYPFFTVEETGFKGHPIWQCARHIGGAQGKGKVSDVPKGTRLPARVEQALSTYSA